MNVLIVDDHALFRHGLSLTLAELFDGASISQAGNADEAIALVSGQSRRFDLVLIDLVMPGMNGLEGIRLLREHLGDTPVVVVSSSEDPSDIKSALERGARGYVLKSSAAEVLGHALPLILAGEVYVPAIALSRGEILASRAAEAGGSGKPARPAEKAMTRRQIEVLKRLVRGESNKEIARGLGMLESTVKVHVKAILYKLGVKNRTQAAIAGMQQGYATSDDTD
jgi:DNA-binding NarL/FixJ family response regulator